MVLAAIKELAITVGLATARELVVIMVLAVGLVLIEMESVIKGLVTIMGRAQVVQALAKVTFQELVEVLLLWRSSHFWFHLLIQANRQ